jgi:hypothetical protein
LHCTSVYWFFWLIALLPIDFFWLIALLPIGFFYLIASIYWLMFGLVWICSIGFVLVSLDWIVCWINLIWFSSLWWFLCCRWIAFRLVLSWVALFSGLIYNKRKAW